MREQAGCGNSDDDPRIETTDQAMMNINGARFPGGEQHDPTVRSVAALLTYKLKNGGDGAVVLDVPEADPDYGKAIPCPYCG